MSSDVKLLLRWVEHCSLPSCDEKVGAKGVQATNGCHPLCSIPRTILWSRVSMRFPSKPTPLAQDPSTATCQGTSDLVPQSPDFNSVQVCTGSR